MFVKFAHLLFLKTLKKENCNITIYSQYCNKYVVKDFPYLKFNSSSIGDIDCTPSVIIFFMPTNNYFCNYLLRV